MSVIRNGLAGLGAAALIAMVAVIPPAGASSVAAHLNRPPAAVTAAAGHGAVTSGRELSPSKKPKGKIVFTYGPKTGKPVAKLGTHTLKAFPADTRKNYAYVKNVKGPTGKVVFSVKTLHLAVGVGKKKWQTWSNGYKGTVYWVDESIGGSSSVVLTLPKGTKAFYVYVEPDEFSTHDLVVKAQNGVSSGDTKVLGDAGAEFFGFYTTGKQVLKTISISCDDDFSFGEMGIAK